MKLFVLFIFLAMISCSTQDNGEKDEIMIKGEQITYSADEVDLKGYLVYDQNIKGQRPGILVVHEWWGHNEYARKRARMLAEMGYTALAVDMYGEGKQASHPDDAQKFAGEVFQNIATGEARFMAALEILRKQQTTDPEKIAAIGYCFGGSVVLHMARIGTDLDGVVSFHGGLSPVRKAEPGLVKAKILVCNGADDKMVTPEQIDAFKEEMEAAQVEYELINYQGAMHSFTNPDADKFAKEFELPLAYNAEADQQSWQKMSEFLSELFQ